MRAQDDVQHQRRPSQLEQHRIGIENLSNVLRLLPLPGDMRLDRLGGQRKNLHRAIHLQLYRGFVVRGGSAADEAARASLAKKGVHGGDAGVAVLQRHFIQSVEAR